MTTYKSGATAWDSALIPEAEFRERLDDVRAALKRTGVDCLVAFANVNDYSGACYLSGLRDVAFTPFAPLGPTIVLPLRGEPVALALTFDPWRFSSATWMQVEAVGRLPALPAALAEVLAGTERVAAVGFGRCVPARLHGPVTDAFPGSEVVSFDAELSAIMRHKRPRELAAMRVAGAILGRACAAAEKALREGEAPFNAYVRARELAHSEGGRDVCGNGWTAEQSVRPCEELPRARDGSCEIETSMHLALEYQGYWAQAAVDNAGGESSAARALAAMRMVARAGATAGEVAVAAVTSLPRGAAAGAVAYGLGHGIGLGQNEAPVIETDSEAVLDEGDVLALHVLDSARASASLSAATVVVGGTSPAADILVEPN